MKAAPKSVESPKLLHKAEMTVRHVKAAPTIISALVSVIEPLGPICCGPRLCYEGTIRQTIRLVVLLLITMSVYAQEQRQATLTQQKMCAEQARKFYLNPEMGHEGWTAYTNHYDPKLNVCNVMVRIDVYLDKKHTEQFHSVAWMVFDAFEGAQRAWMQSDVLGPNREPHVCEVEPIGHDKIYCKTEDEFEALVMKYFGTKRP